MEDIWNRALRDYQREFRDHLDLEWNPKIPQDLEDRLRVSQIDFTSWRAKHGKLWRALTAIAIPISQIGQHASNAAQAAFPPASAAVSGLLALVTASQKVSESYNFIEQMFTKLEDVLSRWQIDMEHNLDPILQQKAQQILGMVFLIVARSRRFVKRRGRRFLAALIFGKDQETADLLQELEELIVSEDRAKMTLSLDKLKKLLDKATITETARIVEKLNSPSVDNNRRIFGENREDKLANSGTWLKQETLYQKWLQDDISLLMVLGGIKSGKSYIATSLIEELGQQTSPDTKTKSISVGYFYFAQGHDLRSMLRVMAYQIQKTNLDYRHHVIDVFDQDEPSTASETWTQLFLDFWNTDNNPTAQAILVIDGLSEALPEEIETFAQKMVKPIISESSFNIKLAILGRMSLEKDFDFLPTGGFVKVDSEKNRDDLEAYIDRELAKNKLLKKPSNRDAKAEFQAGILEHCAENFEGARLLLSRCKDKEKSQIRRILKTAPETLDGMIKSCFDQITKDGDFDTFMLKVLFTWLTYQKQLSRFGEIYNAISLATGEEYELFWQNIVGKFSSVIRWQGARVREWSGQVLAINEDPIETLDEDKGWSDQVAKARISFTNSEIRNYVIRQSTSSDIVNTEAESSPWPWPVQQSECEMVKICFQTLQRADLLEEKNRHLMLYPLECIMLHLEKLELAAISHEDKSTIVQGLVWMLCEENSFQIIALSFDILRKPRIFWQTWIETTDNIHLVQTWLRWAIENDFNAELESTRWMRAACVSVKSFFAPMANFLRQAWLKASYPPKPLDELGDEMAAASFAPFFLSSYDNMSEQEEFPERYRNYNSIAAVPILTEDIIKSAEISGFEKDGNYFIGLAAAMFDQKMSAEAFKFLRAVPADDKYAWVSALMMAVAYGAQHKYEQAIFHIKRACELNTDFGLSMEPLVTGWQLSSNDLAGALSTATAAYEQNSDQIGVQRTYLYCLALQQDVTTTVKTLRELDRKIKDDGPNSYLTDILVAHRKPEKGRSSIWLSFTQVCLLSKHPEDRMFVMEAVNKGRESLMHSQGELRQIYWLNAYAEFLLGFGEQDLTQRATSLLLANVDRVTQSTLLSNKNERAHLLVTTRAYYALALFELAERQRMASDSDLSSTLKALKGLADSAETVDKALLSPDLACRAEYPRFIYGRWIHRFDSRDDQSWRKYFRTSLLMSLAMFDDDSPQNDSLGVKLTKTALYFADEYEKLRGFYVLSVWQAMIDRDISSDGKSDAKDNYVDGSPQSSTKTLATSTNGFDNSLNKTSDFQQAKESLRTVNSGDVNSYTLTNGLRNFLPIYIKTDITDECYVCHTDILYVQRLYRCRNLLIKLCEKCLPQTPIHPTLGRRFGNHIQVEQIWPVSKDIIDRVGIRNGDSLFMKRSWLEEIRNEWREKDDEDKRAEQQC